MTESPDPQLQFKKRARRRLVGAIAFAGLAAVVLPMVMDEEPKQPAQDVQIRIPGQDQPPLRPPLATLAESSSAQANSAAQGEQTTKAADEASARSGEPHAEAGPAAVSAPPPSEKAGERTATGPAEKPAEKAPGRKRGKPGEKAQSLMLHAVSRRRTSLNSSSRSGPGESCSALARNPAAMAFHCSAARSGSFVMAIDDPMSTHHICLKVPRFII